MKTKAILIIHCANCPCMNISEYGEECNLGFEIYERSAYRFNGLRAQLPKDWQKMSFDCRLHAVQITDDRSDWQPERLEILQK